MQQRLSEAQSPALLSHSLPDFVLAEFDLQVRKLPAQRVVWRAVVDLRIQIIRLIVPNSHIAWLAQGCKHGVGKPPVQMAGESDLPGSRFVRERRRHGVNRNRDRWHASRFALQKNGFDGVVIGREPALDAGRPGCLAEMQVAGNRGPIAYFRNQVRGIQMAVAIDYQARCAA